jgi:hypothetical protein
MHTAAVVRLAASQEGSPVQMVDALARGRSTKPEAVTPFRFARRKFASLGEFGRSRSA